MHLGPLHPCILAIHHNDPKLLSEILSTSGFPQISPDLYIGIIEFATRLQHRECVSAMQRYLFDNKEVNIPLTYRDYLMLLRSDSVEAHNALANIVCQDELEIIPNIHQQESAVNIEMHSNVLTLISGFNDPKSKMGKTLNRNEAFSKADQLSKAKAYTERFVTNSRLPFKINPELGSKEILEFMHVYSLSESEDFINSDFKHLVNQRWDKLWLFHFFANFVFFLFTLSLVLHTVFYKEVLAFKFVTLIFIGLLVIWEFLQLISFFIMLKNM
jgi:hypothetical protein